MADSEYDRLRAVSPEDADLMEAAFSRDSWAPLARRLRELLEDKRRMDWFEEHTNHARRDKPYAETVRQFIDRASGAIP